MSSMERNKGKLYPSSLEEVCKKYPRLALEDALTDLEYWTDEEFTTFGGKIYRVEWEVRCETDGSFSDVEVMEDGSISFHTYHYNGGACWSEIVGNYLK